MPKKKRAKFSIQPKQQKVPRIAEDAEHFRNLNFKWCAVESYVDYDHGEWGWRKVKIQEFFQKLLPRLQNYETMSWSDILRHGSCHDMEVSELCGEAKRRLQETLPEIDTLHQLKITQNCRLWGHIDRQILYLIWHDPKHTVYPV